MLGPAPPRCTNHSSVLWCVDQSEASIHLLQLLARLVVADKGEVPGGVQTLGIMKGSEYGEL